jgi:hypothetical protein
MRRFIASLIFIGCGEMDVDVRGSMPTPPSVVDAGGHDAGVPAMHDAGMTYDAGATHDAGTPPPFDAGVIDSGVPDASTPAVGCAGSTFALCEDFEGAQGLSAQWTVSASHGTATLDTTRSRASSGHSLHVHVDTGSDTTVGIIEKKTFPALKGGFYARAFIFIPSASSTSLFTGDRHTRLIYGLGANPYNEYALGIWNGGLIQNHYSPNDDSVDTQMLPPFDQWFCLEYHLDATTGTVAAYLDDVEIVALRHSGWPSTNITQLMFGADRFGNFPVAEEIWFDDIAVDTQRIGCTH